MSRNQNRQQQQNRQSAARPTAPTATEQAIDQIVDQMTDNDDDDAAEGVEEQPEQVSPEMRALLAIFGTAENLVNGVIPHTGNDLLPFGYVKFAPAPNGKTFTDEKGGTRTLIAGIYQFSASELYGKFNIGIRWKAGSQDEAETYIAMGSVGKFNAAIASNDAATSDALEIWKAEVLNAGIKWMQHRIASAPKRNGASAAAVPAQMKVSASALGLNIGNLVKK